MGLWWSAFIRKGVLTMRKYWEISKIYMKTQLVWRADVIFNMIFTISKILFAYLLWGIIFQKQELVGAFTFHDMLSYYIVNSFLSQLEMSESISNEIHNRLRNGTFSKYIVIPVGIERHFMAMELGVVLFYLVFDFAAAVVWIFVFQIQFVFADQWWVIVCGIMMAVLGMVFMVQLNYLLGILTLRFEGIGTFFDDKKQSGIICYGKYYSTGTVSRVCDWYFTAAAFLLRHISARHAVDGKMSRGSI